MKFAIVTAAGALAVTALGFSGAAAAAPIGGSEAADTINQLQDQGYNVQINGSLDVPLSRCTITGMHGLRGTGVDSVGLPIQPAPGFTTVYVDVSCPLNDP